MQPVQDRLILVATAYIAQKHPSEPAGPFIDIIIALLPTLIPLFVQCFSTPPAQLAAVKNPGLAMRWRLRAEIFRKMPGLDQDSVEARDVVFAATLAAAKTLTAEELAALSA